MGSPHRRSSSGPPIEAVVGIAVWVVVFAAATGPLSDRIGLLEGLWLIGSLVVVPLGLAVLRPPPGMPELRGMVSGLGFVVGGLLGWTLADLPEEIER